MNKFLGIYFKRDRFTDQHIERAVAHFKNTSGNNTFSQTAFGRLMLCIIEHGDKKNTTVQTMQHYFAFGGLMYPAHLPENIPVSLSHQKINFFARTYEMHREKALSYARGKFNFLVYGKDHVLKIYNDILGLFPLLYYEDTHVVIFSHHIEPILIYKEGLRKQLDVAALTQYLLCGAPQGTITFIEGIRFLPPGSCFTLDGTKLKISTYLPALKTEHNKNPLEETADLYFEKLKKEVKLMLAWHPDIPVTLTGGADTRMILGAMEEPERQRRLFITFRSTYVGDNENQDILIARILTEKYGLKHEVRDNAIYAIARPDSNYFSLLSSGFAPVVSGYLGSETLRFYNSYPTNISEIIRSLFSTKNITYKPEPEADFFISLKKEYSYRKKVNEAKRHLNPYFSKFIPELFYANKLKKEILHTIYNIKSPFSEEPYTNMYITRSFFSRHCSGARSSVLMPFLLTRNLFSPFMAPSLLKIIWSLHPSQLKSDQSGLTRMIFKRHLKELSEIPSNSHLGHYPNDVLPAYNKGLHTIDHINISYPPPEALFSKEITEAYNHIFNFEAIRRDFFGATPHSKSYIWADLFMWLRYIQGLG